jgi:hypothetical protein
MRGFPVNGDLWVANWPLAIHLLVTRAKFLGPGGTRQVAAEKARQTTAGSVGRR